MVKKILAGILCAATMITLSVGCSDSAAPGASTDPSAKITAVSYTHLTLPTT